MTSAPASSLTDAEITQRLEAIRDAWTNRLRDWEADAAQELNEQVKVRKLKALALLRQGIDPYRTIQEATGSPGYVKHLRETRLGLF